MMNTLKLAIIILALGLALAGCSPLRSPTPTGKSTSQDDIRLSTGNATLAESLEQAKPLVDLNLEE
jgi:outer membrane protein assembly factor BamE (lipoprotein component of BamABCDE complex)